MSVTIIIPTLCASDRAKLLRRAVEGVTSQLSPDGRLVVVANGDRWDAGLLRELRHVPRVAVEQLSEGNVANAQRHGRSLVATEYFGFLDDDDEYLPGAVELRQAYLDSHPDVDVVVTNGFRRTNGTDVPAIEDTRRAVNDPLRALWRENWLASCAALFRTRTVGLEFFDGANRYLEWTLLAYRLAVRRSIHFVNIPTYRVHATPESASLSVEYLEAMPGVLHDILALDLPGDVRRLIRRRIASSEHSLAAHFLASGDRACAWTHHLRSLHSGGVLRFAAFTRKFLPGRMLNGRNRPR